MCIYDPGPIKYPGTIDLSILSAEQDPSYSGTRNVRYAIPLPEFARPPLPLSSGTRTKAYVNSADSLTPHVTGSFSRRSIAVPQ